MNIIAVDDEKIALERLISAIRQSQPDAEVTGFRSPNEAIANTAESLCDIAFLDVEMREMDGIDLAKRLKLQNPKINIIFTTGYSDYTGDAFSIHASGYVMKPITADKITAEIAELRHPVVVPPDKRVHVHTFGNFEVYLDGKPVDFQYSKTKELFAYLVDRQGALCTNNELMAILWDDEIKESYFRNVRADLLKALPENVFVRQWGKLGLRTEELSCDYYDWLVGKPAAINAYNSEYMTQYSWSENTLGTIRMT